MILQQFIVKNKKPKIKYEDYLSLESEPRLSKFYEIDLEIEEDLRANRFFLKRRVWKNMDKIRVTNARLNTPRQSYNQKVFKLRHSHMSI
jgi:hypothetical protein